MAPKSSNTNIKNIDHVNVDLKFDNDTIQIGKDGEETELVLRTWANPETFVEYHGDYEDSQENSSLRKQFVTGSIRVKATLPIIDENEKIKKEIIKTAFVAMTTVYGGNGVIKSFLNKSNHGICFSI